MMNVISGGDGVYGGRGVGPNKDAGGGSDGYRKRTWRG